MPAVTYSDVSTLFEQIRFSGHYDTCSDEQIEQIAEKFQLLEKAVPVSTKHKSMDTVLDEASSRLYAELVELARSFGFFIT